MVVLAAPRAAATAAAYARERPQRERWLAELGQLLAFPTISAQPRHARDLQAAAHWLARHLASVGLEHAQVLPGPEGSAPHVFAEWRHAPSQPTLLLYGHYDVQPVDPIAAWRTPPFQAVRAGHSLYARGASDDKGQLFAHLKAIESVLATTGRLPVNVKVWLEGEEEIDSPHLPAFLAREAPRLRADCALISDTEMLGPEQPSIIYGLRGNLACGLEVGGPSRDLHSGRFGGAVRNPLQALCALLAGLHDANGRVAVPGFYRSVRPVSQAERRALRRAGPPDARLLAAAGVEQGWGEPGYSAYERTIVRPALAVSGLSGGYVGPGTKAIVPARAEARLSLRLVPDQEPEEIAALLGRFVAEHAPPGVQAALHVRGAVAPLLMPHDHPAMAAAVRAVTRAWGIPPVFTRSGGSIRAASYLFRRLGLPVLLVGFGLSDDNIHAPNEKLSLPHFFRGVETVIYLLEELAR